MWTPWIWQNIVPVIRSLIGGLLVKQTNKHYMWCMCVRLFATPWTAAHQASLSITNSRSLLRPISMEPVMPSNHLILCHPLLLPPSIFPSIRVFSDESVLQIRWPKYWSFSFSISPSCVCSGLISFRMDWLDLLAVPRTLNSLLHHHSSKASILFKHQDLDQRTQQTQTRLFLYLKVLGEKSTQEVRGNASDSVDVTSSQ